MPRGTQTTLRLTRDSVAAGDDVDAPHERLIRLDADAGATDIARVLLAKYTATINGGTATWWLSLGPDLVIFGLRGPEAYVLPVDLDTHRMRAADVKAIHVHYVGQDDPGDVRIRLLANRERD